METSALGGILNFQDLNVSPARGKKDRSMTTKCFVIILVSCLGIFILSAAVNGILESSGISYQNTLDPEIKTAIHVFYFILFLALGFSFIPLVIKLFIFLQLKIGNGELFLVKFLQSHEQIIVYCAWGMSVLGLMISLPSAIKEGFFK